MLMHCTTKFRQTLCRIIMQCAAIVPFCMLPASACSQAAEPPRITVSITPERVEQGSVARIIITGPGQTATLSYTWHEISAPLFLDQPGVFYGFIPIAMEHSPGPKRLTVTILNAGNKAWVHEAAFEIIPKKFDEQHITVVESKVTLNAKDLERHNCERALIQKMFAGSLPRRLWSEGFILPVQGRISTPFGVRRFINQQPRSPHSGIDIAAPDGTPVRATSAGRVCLTGDHFFAGKSIYIDHGHAIFSMYFHLDSIMVQDGQTVEKGAVIGRIGATGRATGPHLHWGIRMYNTAVDPLSLLALFE